MVLCFDQMKVTEITNKTGCTPLALAFTNEHVECCELLRTSHTSLVPELRQNADRNDKSGVVTSIDQTAAFSAATSRRVSEISEQNSSDDKLQQSGEPSC
jgi:hypothetical protein